ncbi:MAG TPA: LLM class F420-dependent oxidoreductase [Caulobacteraceae bacterium]|nr:LLM class F420-dependent oxidoreductase [Caulobacteraceae bacterium]
MKLGLSIGLWDSNHRIAIEVIKLAESFGYDSVWSSETYGTDAITPLAFISGHTSKIRLGTSIAQLDARTPANLAMCAQSIEALAGEGRMMLGIGASGPQIVEGWYGRPWGSPNARLRDTITIIKKIFRREGPVSYDGAEISLPYRGERSSGLGKPLKSVLKATPNIPILIGADTPANVRLAGEIADGWMGFHLIPSMASTYRPWLEQGLAKREDGKTMDGFLLHASLSVKVADDVRAALQEPKAQIALFVGGMGAKAKNYHKDSMVKQGYAEAANRIQELFLAGRKDEAARAVPDDYVDDTCLVGPPDRIRQRFRPWRDIGLTTLNIRMNTPDVLKMLADLAVA